MADEQCYYQAYEEAEKASQMSSGSSSPLAPKSRLMSEKGDPAANEGQFLDVTCPIEEMVPILEPYRYYSRRRNTCCRCLGWTFCLLLLLTIAILIAAAILYAIFSHTIQITSM
ncbi:hypothetical protein SUGI_0716560 [Cryptomeria japonica]|nr:hypothetical protein SUGI_0716560 [Cryptomeria japonica]